MKLYLDPGHGGSDSGALGNGLKEKDVVLDIALSIRKILLSDYNNIEIKMSRTDDSFINLVKRTNEANSWGADFYLSIHCNASNGNAEGYEDYIDIRLSNSSRTVKYQEIMHREVIKKNKLIDRGQKKADLHVLRESVMDALLTENGFIDNNHDASLMKDSAWIQNVAQGHVNGLEKIFLLERKVSPFKPKQDANQLYKVIAGSFQSKENAEKHIDFLRSKQIDAFIDSINISDEIFYRVQIGAFSNRKNAEKRKTEVEKAGIDSTFIVVEDKND